MSQQASNPQASPSNKLTPEQAFKGTLEHMAATLKDALPGHMSVEKFQRFVMLAVNMNAGLLTAPRPSLLAAIMKCATCGLVPDGKEAALIPYQGKNPRVDFMPMTQGIAKLMRNSGELSSFTTAVVYSADKFRHYTDDKGEHIEHERDYAAADAKPIGAYAILYLRDGGRICEFMTESQLDDVRAQQKGSNTPWDGPFRDEMKRKSVFKRASKRAPSSTDLDIVLRADDTAAVTDEPSEAPVEDTTPRPQSSRLAALAEQHEPTPATVEIPPMIDTDIPL